MRSNRMRVLLMLVGLIWLVIAVFIFTSTAGLGIAALAFAAVFFVLGATGGERTKH